MCEYLGSMPGMGEDIKSRKILAIEASNQLKIIYDNKNINSRNKNKSIQSIFQSLFSCAIAKSGQ